MASQSTHCGMGGPPAAFGLRVVDGDGFDRAATGRCLRFVHPGNAVMYWTDEERMQVPEPERSQMRKIGNVWIALVAKE